MIKAIETVYNGYRFRSRLEARWAVFFDTLDIKYEYEPEGFDLGKLGYYLPDFWLPIQKYWIEVKGVEPTKQEREKAHILARNGQKNVVILYGMPYAKSIIEDQWRVGVNAQYSSHLFVGNHQDIFGFNCTNIWYNHIERFKDLVKLLETYIQNEGELSDSVPKYNCDEKTISKLIELDREYWNNTGNNGIHPRWIYDDSADNYLWADFGCSEFYLGKEREVTSTPKLLSAYTAARQARFEHGQIGAPSKW